MCLRLRLKKMVQPYFGAGGRSPLSVPGKYQPGLNTGGTCPGKATWIHSDGHWSSRPNPAERERDVKMEYYCRILSAAWNGYLPNPVVGTRLFLGILSHGTTILLPIRRKARPKNLLGTMAKPANHCHRVWSIFWKERALSSPNDHFTTQSHFPSTQGRLQQLVLMRIEPSQMLTRYTFFR